MDIVTYNERKADAANLDGGKLSNKDGSEGVSKTEAQRGDDLAAKEHHDGCAEKLHDDAASTNDAGHDNGPLASDEVADETSRKSRAEDANCVGCVENLLVRRRDDIVLADLVTEAACKRRHSEEFSEGCDFVAKIDRKEVDQKGCEEGMSAQIIQSSENCRTEAKHALVLPNVGPSQLVVGAARLDDVGLFSGHAFLESGGLLLGRLVVCFGVHSEMADVVRCSEVGPVLASSLVGRCLAPGCSSVECSVPQD